MSLLLLLPAYPAEPDIEVAQAEQALREAGVPVDGPGLLAFFRTRALAAREEEQLRLAARRLGDSSFVVREQASAALLAAGRKALPFLRPALGDPDLEIGRRARRCLEEIEANSEAARVTAALRLIVAHRPPGTSEALLEYLPWAGEDALEEAVIQALTVVGLADGKPEPALVAALADGNPLRRAAAVHVVGRSGVAGERRQVVRLLNDPDVRVRFEAATALVGSGEREAVPTLVALVGDAPAPLAWQAEDLLYRLAGDNRPREAGLGAAAGVDRRRCREAWEAWWKEQGPTLELARLQGQEAGRGLTLVCEYDGDNGGRVWEFGRDGKMRWQLTGLQGPNDAQVLPGGRILVAERNAGQVTERDANGKVLWSHGTTSGPIGCQRLANSNTLVVTWTELSEVTLDHKVVFHRSEPAGLRHAVGLPDGQVVYVTSNGRVVVLDAHWKRVRSFRPAAHAGGASYWASVEPLANGHYLLALAGTGRVLEVDGSGKIVWECTESSAVSATRLGNGNTLIACFDGRCLVEVDRAGKEVARHLLHGRPFSVRRY